MRKNRLSLLLDRTDLKTGAVNSLETLVISTDLHGVTLHRTTGILFMVTTLRIQNLRQ